MQPSIFNLIGFDPMSLFDDRTSYNMVNCMKSLERELSNAFKTTGGSQMPNVHVERKDNVDTFYIELPGVAKDAIDVTVVENGLTVSAKRKIGEKETKFNVILESDKDVDNAKVTFVDGLLTITAQAKQPEKAEVRKLNIQ